MYMEFFICHCSATVAMKMPYCPQSLFTLNQYGLDSWWQCRFIGSPIDRRSETSFRRNVLRASIGRKCIERFWRIFMYPTKMVNVQNVAAQEIRDEFKKYSNCALAVSRQQAKLDWKKWIQNEICFLFLSNLPFKSTHRRWRRRAEQQRTIIFDFYSGGENAVQKQYLW